MAGPQVQVPPVGPAGAPGGSARHHAYLPIDGLFPVGRCRGRKGFGGLMTVMGSLAVLCESRLFMERGQRLRGVRQYRQARHGLSGHLSRNTAVRGVPHGGFVRQACVVQQRRRDAAVAVAGDRTPPEFRQTRVLCRVVVFHIITHISSEKLADSAFYVPTQKVCDPTCVMFG
jgi:hypothetical protein